MKGFFRNTLPVLRPAVGLLPRCGLCGLYKTCNSPKMLLAGEGRKSILIVGEAPGKTEDRDGKPFVGKAGQFLQRKLHDSGIDMFRDCWVTNSIICHPPGDNFKDETWVEHCRPNVLKVIKDTQPEKILLFGNRAIKSVIGWLWKEDTEGAFKWAGYEIPSQRLNAWICPNWHPSFLLREDNPVLELWFDRYLKDALALEGRPWQTIPDYRSQVEIVLEPAKTGYILREMIRRGGLVAFDYETTHLKPDSEAAAIYCCSVCWEGKKTIAFPWLGDAAEAMKELLLSDRVEKVGWNAKYEERYTLAKLAIEVSGWVWDGMLSSHVLSNRPGTSGLKFQSFVQLGQEDYSTHMKQYLTSDGSNTPNRIKEASLHETLVYCGIDSLLEFIIAKRQMEEVGYGQ